jgi:hypothetical protein
MKSKIMAIALSAIAFAAASCSNQAFAADTKIMQNNLKTGTEKTLETEAKTQVKHIYTKLSEANKDIKTIIKDYLDVAEISKRFCGEENRDFKDALTEYLMKRFESEAIQKIEGHPLKDEMSVIKKEKTIVVKCKLKAEDGDDIDMTVIFTTKGEILGKIKEVIILNLPIIDGIRTILKTYFDKSKIKINEIKDPSKRAEKCVEALKDTIKTTYAN